MILKAYLVNREGRFFGSIVGSQGGSVGLGQCSGESVVLFGCSDSDAAYAGLFAMTPEGAEGRPFFYRFGGGGGLRAGQRLVLLLGKDLLHGPCLELGLLSVEQLLVVFVLNFLGPLFEDEFGFFEVAQLLQFPGPGDVELRLGFAELIVVHEVVHLQRRGREVGLQKEEGSIKINSTVILCRPYTYIFDPNLAVSLILVGRGMILKLSDTFFQEDFEGSLLATFGESLFHPRDVLVPRIQRIVP